MVKAHSRKWSQQYASKNGSNIKYIIFQISLPIDTKLQYTNANDKVYLLN